MNRIIKKAKTAWKIFTEEGGCVVGYKLAYKLHHREHSGRTEQVKYKKWIKYNEKKKLQIERLSYEPLISVVVPVYNVKQKMLQQCIESVRKQTYTNWELCLADDASTMPEVRKCLADYEGIPQIKITYRQENGHISLCTNTAISQATGEFIAFMDCDDMLAPNALYEVAKLLNADRTLDFIYSDEDKLTENGKKRHQPHFKPDWSPDTMMSLMYTCHLGVYRKTIGDQIGWLRQGFEGAQDYDFTLRFTEKTDHIGHIPKILYHWRERQESTAINPEAKEYVREAAKRAKEEALMRRGYQGEVEWEKDIYQYRVHYKPPKNTLVSVVIPSKDNFDVYKRCVDSLFALTKNVKYEIVTVDNGSNEENRKKYEDYAEQKKITYIYEPMEFNFSRMCNIGVSRSSGNMILLLNDDIEIIQENWMERMAGHAALPYVGAVGAKLLYPNTTLIQHIGVISFENGPVHSFAQMDDTPVYYFCRNKIEYNYSAVTAACLMVEKKKYQEAGGFEEGFAVAYNDVDFCYKLTEHGYYNVSRMDAVLYHHESLSRGSDVMDVQKFERLKKERANLYNKHPQFIGKDFFYNPNLTMHRADCSLNMGPGDGNEKNRRIFKENRGDLISSETCRLRLENVLVDQKEIHISGWFVLLNDKWNNWYKTRVILDNGNIQYTFDTTKGYREDINLMAGCGGKNSLSAFRMIVDINDIEKGAYQIYLSKHGKICDTGQKLFVGKSK